MSWATTGWQRPRSRTGRCSCGASTTFGRSGRREVGLLVGWARPTESLTVGRAHPTKSPLIPIRNLAARFLQNLLHDIGVVRGGFGGEVRAQVIDRLSRLPCAYKRHTQVSALRCLV